MEVDVHDLNEDDDLPITLVESEGVSTYQGITIDMRLSRLDNRLNPREGYFIDWDNTVYGGPFGADNDLWTSQFAYDYYFQLGSKLDDIRSGMYLGLATGVGLPYGDTEFVNYSERYFLGGSNTLRGFDFRGVGPNDGDYALGGETFINTTVELRKPIYSTPIPGTSRLQEVFRMILFLDAGIIDTEPFQLDLSETRVSTGVGFGLTQPIPLVFNFGFALRSGEGDELEVFSFRLDLK